MEGLGVSDGIIGTNDYGYFCAHLHLSSQLRRTPMRDIGCTSYRSSVARALWKVTPGSTPGRPGQVDGSDSAVWRPTRRSLCQCATSGPHQHKCASMAAEAALQLLLYLAVFWQVSNIFPFNAVMAVLIEFAGNYLILLRQIAPFGVAV